MKSVYTAMDACRDNGSKENVFNKEDINVNLAF